MIVCGVLGRAATLGHRRLTSPVTPLVMRILSHSLLVLPSDEDEMASMYALARAKG